MEMRSICSRHCIIYLLFRVFFSQTPSAAMKSENIFDENILTRFTKIGWITESRLMINKPINCSWMLSCWSCCCIIFNKSKHCCLHEVSRAVTIFIIMCCSRWSHWSWLSLVPEDTDTKLTLLHSTTLIQHSTTWLSPATHSHPLSHHTLTTNK